MVAASRLIGSLPESSVNRAKFVERGVVEKYKKMLHPPLNYLGDAFQYRNADRKFNVSYIFTYWAHLESAEASTTSERTKSPSRPSGSAVCKEGPFEDAGSWCSP